MTDVVRTPDKSSETTRTQLQQILTMQQHLPDVIAGIMSLNAMSYDPVGGAGSSLALDSPGLGTITRADHTRGILDPLVDLCHEWARVQGHRLTSQDLASPARWLHGQTTWASKQYAGWADAQAVIAKVYVKLSALTGWGPDHSDRHCPYCDVTIERWPTDDGNPDLWTCPNCARAWIITPEHDGVTDSERELLAQQHVLVKQSEAARIIGVTRACINNWIARGHLTINDGKVWLDETHALLTRAPARAA